MGRQKEGRGGEIERGERWGDRKRGEVGRQKEGRGGETERGEKWGDRKREDRGEVERRGDTV